MQILIWICKNLLFQHGTLQNWLFMEISLPWKFYVIWDKFLIFHGDYLSLFLDKIIDCPAIYKTNF